jgi:hypothetical protein
VRCKKLLVGQSVQTNSITVAFKVLLIPMTEIDQVSTVLLREEQSITTPGWEVIVANQKEKENVLQYRAPTEQPVQALQRRFYLCVATGHLRVVAKEELEDGDELAAPNYYSVMDAKVLLRRALESLPLDIPQGQHRFIIEDFFSSPNTRIVNKFAFDPRDLPDDTLNLWIKPPIKPVPGDWKLIEDWLLTVLCNRDQVAYHYLIRWLAHAIQVPEKKPEVIIVLMGKEGTGKGTLFRLLCLIFNARVILPASKPEQLVGKFNELLDNKFLVWSDEAIFVGNKSAQDDLKHLITEPIITTEGKGKPLKQIRSYHRFIAATNKKHFSYVSPDDRRYAFYKVSEEQMQNKPYFNRLWHSIEKEGALAAFVHHLTNLDLSDFDPTIKPVTQELINQKLLSLEGVVGFMKEVLDADNWVLVKDSNYPVEGLPLTDNQKISTADYADYFKLYDKHVEKHGALKQKAVKGAIFEIFPSATEVRIGNLQAIGFSTVDVMRQEFQTYLTHDIAEWNLPTNTNGDK